jgi:hypothetical protein
VTDLILHRQWRKAPQIGPYRFTGDAFSGFVASCIVSAPKTEEQKMINYELDDKVALSPEGPRASALLARMRWPAQAPLSARGI